MCRWIGWQKSVFSDDFYHHPNEFQQIEKEYGRFEGRESVIK